MTTIVQQLQQGQLTIPADMRRELGIEEDSLLQLSLSNGELHIKLITSRESANGSPWLRNLYDDFAPVREEILAREISEEEVHADIDAAVAAARAARAKNG
jgi:bifunctional DNA-binding transcriptional regulator/antitoxin component of YhaV-PrlF toxin-antitoxin module